MMKTLLKSSKVRLLVICLLLWQQPSWSQVLALAQSTTRQPAEFTTTIASRKLKDVLNDLKNQYQVEIMYELKTVEKFIVESDAVKANLKLEKNLDNILIPLGLRYKKVNKTSYLVLEEKNSKERAETNAPFLESSTDKSNPSQTSIKANTPETELKVLEQTVSGKIIDDKGDIVPGANISIKGTSRGTSANGKGEYSISVPDNNAVLVFSSIGYLSQEMTVGNKTTINVTLQTDIKNLTEVVVVGYGTQERRDVTGAVATIKSQNVRDLPLTSVDQKIAGQVAGVQVSQVTGAPGSGPVIRIRGAGSIGAGDDPLYVIDGFPITNFYGKFSNPLATISPDDIESITVLKDASSTAIYGSRGSNGVILVTTKRAKSGVTSIEFNAYTGIQSIQDRNHVFVLTAEQLAQHRIDGQVQLAAIKNLPYSINNVAEIYRNPSALGAGTDWFNALTRNAPMQSYGLTISKGTESVRTMVSLNYFDQKGVILNTDFKRFSARVNVDANLGKKVTVGFNFSPTFTIRNNAETEGHFNTAIITQAYLNSPIPPIYQADGTFTPNITSTGLFNNANPLNMLVNTTNYTNNFRAISNLYGSIELLPNLRFMSSINADILFDATDTFTPSYVGGFRNPPPTLATGSNNAQRTYNWLWENTINYAKTIKNHRITGLVGYSAQREYFKSTVARGNGYADDVIQTINSALATGVTAGAGGGEAALLSYLARATYAYQDRYLLNVAVRRDGSSKFGSDNRWGTFPSASIGWRISEEKFFPKTGFVDELKLRVSYGLAGNNNIGNFTSQQLLGLDNYVVGGKIVTGQAITSLGNSNLGWEESKQTDIGLDASFFKGKVSLILELYQRFTQSMLQSIDIPASSGFTTTITNIGNVRNQGLEITIGTKNLSTSKLRWTTDFNISFNQNRVINLGNRTRIQSGDAGSVTQLDQPMGMFYGYKRAGGFFNTADDLTKYAKAAGQTIGSIRFEDVNGDGKIDGNDLTIIGNPYADFIWGMTNRLSYGNFDFSVLINGSQGNQILDFYKRFLYNQDGVFNQHTDILQGYKDVNNQGNGRIQSAGSALAGDSFSRNTSDAWVMDGSYMVVRNVTLGYNFTPKKYLKGVRVYFSGQNLLVLSGYKGTFPEVGFAGNNSLSPGVNYDAYPVAATFTIGLNCKF